MTAVGKIFVFLVLIFSLIQGGLMVMSYITRTPYALQNDDLRKQLLVARANADQFAAEKKQADTDAAALVATKDVEVKKLQEEIKAKADQLADLQATEQKRKIEQITLQATMESLQADLKRRQADVEQLRITLDDELNKKKDLVELNNTLRQEKVTADIRANALDVRNHDMEEQLKKQAHEIAVAKSPLAGGAGKTGTGKNPPAENIEGLIRQSDPSGLVKITIGSDAGLVKGNTLEVFRLSNIADQSKYLGTIKIIDVSATEAVGQPMGRMAAPVQVGDRVASRILRAS